MFDTIYFCNRKASSIKKNEDKKKLNLDIDYIHFKRNFSFDKLMGYRTHAERRISVHEHFPNLLSRLI